MRKQEPLTSSTQWLGAVGSTTHYCLPLPPQGRFGDPLWSPLVFFQSNVPLRQAFGYLPTILNVLLCDEQENDAWECF